MHMMPYLGAEVEILEHLTLTTWASVLTIYWRQFLGRPVIVAGGFNGFNGYNVFNENQMESGEYHEIQST